MERGFQQSPSSKIHNGSVRKDYKRRSHNRQNIWSTAVIIKEWKCALHGSFEGSHPICPHFGCESDDVEREFKTPISIKSDLTKFTDAGLQKTADVYGLSDMRNTDGSSVRSNIPIEQQAVWGNANGVQFESMMAKAQQDIVIKRENKPDLIAHNSGMVATSQATGNFGGRVVPPAEITVAKSDPQDVQKVKS